MIKVIVTGAYSTGKTILVDLLQEKLLELDISVKKLPDVARGSPVPLNHGQTDDASLWLLMTQISREIAAAFGTEQVMLCDRGVPDVLAHYHDVRARLGDGKVRLLDGFLISWLETYDLILLSRVDQSFPIALDGLRSGDPAYRTMLDSQAAKMLLGRERVCELPFGNSQRLDYARGLIEGMLFSSEAVGKSPSM